MPPEPGPIPSLSVVIPSLDGARRLPETLAAVAAQEVDGEAEVIVVDDGSSDATSAVASEARLPWGAPRVVRHSEPRARAAACNSGISAARAGVILVLDDDMTLSPGALAAHLAFHASHARSAALGRITLARRATETSFARFLDREEENRERMLLAEREDLPFALCLTGHFSAPKAVLDEVGGYDTRIKRYGFEDIELGFRLTQAGVRLEYLPAAESVHRAWAVSLDRFLHRHFEEGVTAGELAARHPSGAFREYLRVDGPARNPRGRVGAGLAALRAANRVLVFRPARAAMAAAPLYAALRAGVRACEAISLDRAAHFGYRVAADLHYFRGAFGEREPGAGR